MRHDGCEFIATLAEQKLFQMHTSWPLNIDFTYCYVYAAVQQKQPCNSTCVWHMHLRGYGAMNAHKLSVHWHDRGARQHLCSGRNKWLIFKRYLTPGKPPIPMGVRITHRKDILSLRFANVTMRLFDGFGTGNSALRMVAKRSPNWVEKFSKTRLGKTSEMVPT